MTQELFNIFSAAFGVATAVTICVVVAIWWLSIYVTKKVIKINNDHDTLSKTIDKAEKNIDEIRRDLSYIKGSLDILQNPKSANNPLFQSQSPVSVTSAGRMVAEEMGADNILSDNWGLISDTMKSVANKSAYDIQQFCIETASISPELFFDDKSLSNVKKYAYEHGLPLPLYLRLLGVLIRDKYFDLNNMPISDIDRTDPNKG